MSGNIVHGFRLRCQRIEVQIRSGNVSMANPLQRYQVATTGAVSTIDTPPIIHGVSGTPAYRSIFTATGLRHLVAMELYFPKTDFQCLDMIGARATLQFVAAYTRDTLEILP